MNEKKIKDGITRRVFIKGAALGTGAIAVAGLGGLSETHAEPPPKKWDVEADVIVVGGGGAGLAAAIQAKDAGSKVILIEKTAVLGGSS